MEEGDDIPSGGREGPRRVKPQLQIQNEGRDDIRPGGREGNVSDRDYDHKTTARTTYSLEVQRRGLMSDCSWDYR